MLLCRALAAREVVAVLLFAVTLLGAAILILPWYVVVAPLPAIAPALRFRPVARWRIAVCALTLLVASVITRLTTTGAHPLQVAWD